MITLYQFEISPFCDKIRRILNLKGQEFKTVDLSLLETLKGDAKKYSVTGKLPAINHDGKRICDSTDIAVYLEEAFPQNPIYPLNKKDRALAHFFEDWADESLYFFEMHLRLVQRHNAKRWSAELTKTDNFLLKMIAPTAVPRAMEKITKAQGIGLKTIGQIEKEMRDHLKAIENWLDGSDWLVGDAISIADISVFCQLYCVQGSVEGKRLIDENSVVAQWMTRVDEATNQKVEASVAEAIPA